jgi:TIR domain
MLKFEDFIQRAERRPMPDSYRFDVFVSYRQRSPDQEWVRGPLYNTLGEAGLRMFIDVEQFRLGEPVIKEMARGVEESAYTIAIVTPAYLQSAFTEFENLISQHVGLEGASHRLIVVKREQCELPLRLRYKLWLPMQNDAEVAQNLPRLLATLKTPPVQ